MGLWGPICSRCFWQIWLNCYHVRWEIRHNRFFYYMCEIFKCVFYPPMCCCNWFPCRSTYCLRDWRSLDLHTLTFDEGRRDYFLISPCLIIFWCRSTLKLARYFALTSSISYLLHSSNSCWSSTERFSIVDFSMLPGEISKWSLWSTISGWSLLGHTFCNYLILRRFDKFMKKRDMRE
jgi:hypothetical protein